jgi:hypothetical protein
MNRVTRPFPAAGWPASNFEREAAGMVDSRENRRNSAPGGLSKLASNSPLRTTIEAKLAALSLDERLKLQESVADALAEISRTVEHGWRYQKDLLRRLGVRTNLENSEEFFLQTWAAARSIGIPSEEFWNLTPREICAVLEHRATELELLRRPSVPDPQRRQSLKKGQAKQSGRPRGETVNGRHLRACRGELSQEEFADKCLVSLATIQRGEAHGRWTDSTFEKVREVLPPEDFKKLKK